MNITILSVGNKMPGWIKSGYEEYAKRLSHEHNINLIELADNKDMLKKIPLKSYVIGLDEKAKPIIQQHLLSDYNLWATTSLF